MGPSPTKVYLENKLIRKTPSVRITSHVAVVCSPGGITRCSRHRQITYVRQGGALKVLLEVVVPVMGGLWS